MKRLINAFTKGRKYSLEFKCPYLANCLLNAAALFIIKDIAFHIQRVS